MRAKSGSGDGGGVGVRFFDVLQDSFSCWLLSGFMDSRQDRMGPVMVGEDVSHLVRQLLLAAVGVLLM